MERRATALADYTITEATTSAMVAVFLYGFTRLTAPFLGKPAENETRVFSPAAPVVTRHVNPQMNDAPTAQIDAKTIQRNNAIAQATNAPKR